MRSGGISSGSVFLEVGKAVSIFVIVGIEQGVEERKSGIDVARRVLPAGFGTMEDVLRRRPILGNLRESLTEENMILVEDGSKKVEGADGLARVGDIVVDGVVGVLDHVLP